MESNMYTEYYCIRSKGVKHFNIVSLNYNKNKQDEPETHQNSLDSTDGVCVLRVFLAGQSRFQCLLSGTMVLGHLDSSLTGPGENSAPGVAHHQRGVTPEETSWALVPPYSCNNIKSWS